MIDYSDLRGKMIKPERRFKKFKSKNKTEKNDDLNRFMSDSELTEFFEGQRRQAK
jgi:hypothetical protein